MPRRKRPALDIDPAVLDGLNARLLPGLEALLSEPAPDLLALVNEPLPDLVWEPLPDLVLEVGEMPELFTPAEADALSQALAAIDEKYHEGRVVYIPAGPPKVERPRRKRKRPA